MHNFYLSSSIFFGIILFVTNLYFLPNIWQYSHHYINTYEGRFLMFTMNELNSIDRQYFRIVGASSYAVTLQSKNTKHYWHIIKIVYPHFTSCNIFHSHHGTWNYHLHGHAPTLQDAVRSIKSHDVFQLNGRKRTKPKHSSKSKNYSYI